MAVLHALVEVLPAAFDRRLQSLGLTGYEFLLLDTLAAAEEGRLRLSALATSTHASLSRLSRVATALERKNMIVRMPCPADGRATNAVLTADGRRAHRRAKQIHDDLMGQVLGRLDSVDARDLTRLSREVLAGVEAAGTVPARR